MSESVWLVGHGFYDYDSVVSVHPSEKGALAKIRSLHPTTRPQMGGDIHDFIPQPDEDGGYSCRYIYNGVAECGLYIERHVIEPDTLDAVPQRSTLPPTGSDPA